MAEAGISTNKMWKADLFKALVNFQKLSKGRMGLSRLMSYS